MPNYGNRRKADVKNPKPGLVNQILVAPRSWLITLGAPTPGAVLGSANRILSTSSHAFVAGRGFLNLYAEPHKQTAESYQIGDTEGGLATRWKINGILPGDDAATQELLDALLNDDLIVLVRDGDVSTSTVYQFGSDFDPVYVKEQKYSSGTTNSGNKGWSLTMDAGSRAFYEGTIAIHP